MLILFYTNIFWLLKRILQWEKSLYRLLAVIIWMLFLYIADYFLVSFFLQHTSIRQVEWKRLQTGIFLLFLFVLGISVAWFFVKEWYRNEMVRRQLAANQLATEIRFLKSQVNPHFLFNTLNNLFSMAQQKGNDELADSISKLAGMMRYMIYESNAEHVPLEKEIQCLRDCIALNKLRYEDKEAIVNFGCSPGITSVSIAPMIFIPFVENAFKHGIAINQPSQIDISIAMREQQLVFTCENTNYSNIKKMDNENNGIGMENVKRRLELLYPGAYELEIKNKANKYQVLLKINLT